MGQALGNVLPLAVAVAIFPVPIVAVVLLLGSDHGTPTGIAFVLAWCAGLAAVGAIVLLLAGVLDRDYVGVRPLRARARLAADALDVILVARVLLVQDLECNGAFEQPIVRAKHVRHPARADELLQLVAARDELTDHGLKFG